LFMAISIATLAVGCSKNNEDANKDAIVEELGGRSCIAIGNGFNDGLMFEKSALGIIVLGNEGCSTKSLMKAEIMCKSIEDALDLILKKDRLVATLRG